MNNNDKETNRAFWIRPNTVNPDEINKPFHQKPTFSLTRHNIYLFLIGWGKRILVTCGPIMLFFIVVVGINNILPLPKSNYNLYEYLIPVFILLIVIVSISYIIKVRDEGLPQTPPSKRTQPENTGKPLSREEILSRSRADNISINNEGYPEFSEEREARKREQLQLNYWSSTACFLMLVFLYEEKMIITGEIETNLFSILLMTWMSANSFAKWFLKKTKQELVYGLLFSLSTIWELVYYFKHLLTGISG